MLRDGQTERELQRQMEQPRDAVWYLGNVSCDDSGTLSRKQSVSVCWPPGGNLCLPSIIHIHRCFPLPKYRRDIQIRSRARSHTARFGARKEIKVPMQTRKPACSGAGRINFPFSFAPVDGVCGRQAKTRPAKKSHRKNGKTIGLARLPIRRRNLIPHRVSDANS